MTSHSLWSQHDRHVVGITRHNAWSEGAKIYCVIQIQEAQLSPSDRAMRLVSSNLANYYATAHKLLIRQVLTKPMV